MSLLPMSTVNSLDYDIVHKHFGHPSKDALKKASNNTKNFPSGITFPKHNPLCKRCVEDKMPLQSFSPTESQAKQPFELAHMDLKLLPVVSYHKYKHLLTFLDDCASHDRITMLKSKSDTN